MAAAASDQESEKELKRIDHEKVEILEPKEEEKKIEPRVADEIKKIKTDEEPKAAEPETVAAASTESGAKIEEKKTEPPVAEEAEEIRTYEKPKAEYAPEPTAQKVDDKQVESPAIKEETKTEDRGTKETVLESGTTNNSEPRTECKSEDKTGTGSAAEKEESRSESVEEKIEELPSKVEELPAAEVETIGPDDVKVSKNLESTPSVEEKPLEKPLEQPKVAEVTVKEPIVVDPVKDVEVETGIDKVEDSKLPIEVEAPKEETIVVEISDQVDSDNPEIKVLVKDVEYSPSGEVSEKTVETRAEKIEPRKNEVETAEKSVVADKSSAECEGETERTALSEAISKDIELENEKKEETVASGETNTAAEVDDKAEKEATITKREAKEAEKTPVTETKLEEEKKDDEAVKGDAQDSECTNDSKETKTSQDVPKEDVPVKKQSNNIIKMVKHSLGKAKKAITGKSQNSKAPAASETKDELTK